MQLSCAQDARVTGCRLIKSVNGSCGTLVRGFGYNCFKYLLPGLEGHSHQYTNTHTHTEHTRTLAHTHKYMRTLRGTYTIKNLQWYFRSLSLVFFTFQHFLRGSFLFSYACPEQMLHRMLVSMSFDHYL